MNQPNRSAENLRTAWFVPVDGDGHYIGTDVAERPPTFENLQTVVQAAEDSGYDYLLIPTRFANGLFGPDAPLAETWTTATGLLATTKRARLLIAVRPGFVAPGLFAQMAAALANNTHGRVDINIVPGGIQGDFERFGVTTSHDDRYAAAAELMDACTQLWQGEPVDYTGETVTLSGAQVSPPPPSGSLRFYLGGASDNALGLAGEWADVLLAWIQPQDATAALLGRARSHFEARGRTPKFGLRTHLVVGDSNADAWARADDLLSKTSPTVLAARQKAFVGTTAVGQKAQLAAADGDYRISERLWNGISTVRVNCGTAIVGSPDDIADELAAYWCLGMDEFILSAWPHAEEAERVAVDVLPKFRDRIA
jgi:alkanesulfonate monooxygenase